MLMSRVCRVHTACVLGAKRTVLRQWARVTCEFQWCAEVSQAFPSGHAQCNKTRPTRESLRIETDTSLTPVSLADPEPDVDQHRCSDASGIQVRLGEWADAPHANKGFHTDDVASKF